MRVFFSFTALSLFYCVFSISVFSQAPTPTPPENDDSEVVRIDTNLIQIDATVTDKNGVAITNLNADDFEVLQDGKPQKIISFSFFKPAAKKQTNIPNAVRSAQGRIITFIIDDGNCLATAEGISAAQQTMTTFIDEQMLPTDKVAVYRTRGGSSLLQIYTSDRNVLRRTVERVKWFPTACGSSFTPAQNDTTARQPYGMHGLESGENQTGSTSLQSFETESSKEVRRFFESNQRAAQASGTIGVLGFVVDRLKELPQRKLVFLLSEGIAGGENLEALQDISDRAGRASVVIYTITGRTMTSSGMFQASDDVELNAARTNSSAEQIRQDRITEESSLNSGLNYLAETTGGRFIRNKALPKDEIKGILDAETGYYLLGYEPEGETFRGKQFHKIEVRLKKRPELEVGARRGFYGTSQKSDDKKVKPKSRTNEISLYQALFSPVLENELNVRLTTLCEHEKKEDRIRALFHIKGEDLTLVNDDDGMKKVVLETVGILFDEDGKVIDEFNQTYPIRIPKNGIQTVLSNGLDYSRDFKVKKPGVHSVRFIIRDSNSKRLGTVADYVEVPDFKKGGFSVANFLTTEITKNGKPLMMKTRPNDAAFAPVFFQSLPSIRRYYRNTAMAYTYSIYNPKLDDVSKMPKLSVQIKLYRAGKIVTELKEKPVEIEKRDDLTNIQSFGFLKLSDAMTVGEYVLQIIVKDQLNNKTASKWIDFEIIQ